MCIRPRKIRKLTGTPAASPISRIECLIESIASLAPKRALMTASSLDVFASSSHCYILFLGSGQMPILAKKTNCLNVKVATQIIFQFYVSRNITFSSKDIRFIIDSIPLTKRKLRLGSTFSAFSLLQQSIIYLYTSHWSSANLLNKLNCFSRDEFASDNFFHVSKDFWGSDFCHFFTAPTIEGVDDPPAPGSPSNWQNYRKAKDKSARKI